MESHFETFSEDKICAINEEVVQTNTKKVTNFGLSVFTVRQKIIFMLNLQPFALDKIPQMFVNCKQSSHLVMVLIYKMLLFFQFYQTDLVNTKTTIPHRVSENARYIPQHFTYQYISTTIHLPSRNNIASEPYLTFSPICLLCLLRR